MPDPQHIFKTLDLNGDGYISKEEMEKSKDFLNTLTKQDNQRERSSKQISPSTMFLQLDANNNGKIEPKEIDKSLDDGIEISISVS